MTVTHDYPLSAEPPVWHDPSGTGPGDPGGPGPGPARPPRHPWRRRFTAAAAAAGIALTAAGATWAARSAAGGSLTTAQIAAKTDPGLVDVVSTLGYAHGSAAGTGMVLTADGEVLTNNHVVEGATAIRVTDVGNGRTYTASVAGYDASKDIAVLRLHGASGLATVTLGDSSTVTAGDKVVGIGNAGGKGGTPSVAAGRVAATGRSITASDEASGSSEQLSGLILSNADIQPGDSGGPLVNDQGQVVGIDTAGSSSYQLAGNSNSTQAYTVPINTAVAVATAIEAGHGSATVHIGATSFLGIEVQSQSSGFPGSAGGTGAMVVGVLAGSPAGQAGLAAGDQISSVGGRTVGTPTDIQRALVRHHPGDHVTVTWVDQFGQSHSAALTLTSGPPA